MASPLTDVDPALGLQPILDALSEVGSTRADMMNIGSDLGYADPALMELMAELGLSEDLGSINLMSNAVRYATEADRQRGKMDRSFRREGELAAANIADRGFAVSRLDDDAPLGLVDSIASELGRDQSERMGEFDYRVGSDLNDMLTNLGATGLENLTGVARQVDDGAKASTNRRTG